jgi:hypothetical protein
VTGVQTCALPICTKTTPRIKTSDINFDHGAFVLGEYAVEAYGMYVSDKSVSLTGQGNSGNPHIFGLERFGLDSSIMIWDGEISLAPITARYPTLVLQDVNGKIYKNRGYLPSQSEINELQNEARKLHVSTGIIDQENYSEWLGYLQSYRTRLENDENERKNVIDLNVKHIDSVLDAYYVADPSVLSNRLAKEVGDAFKKAVSDTQKIIGQITLIGKLGNVKTAKDFLELAIDLMTKKSNGALTKIEENILDALFDLPESYRDAILEIVNIRMPNNSVTLSGDGFLDFLFKNVTSDALKGASMGKNLLDYAKNKGKEILFDYSVGTVAKAIVGLGELNNTRNESIAYFNNLQKDNLYSMVNFNPDGLKGVTLESLTSEIKKMKAKVDEKVLDFMAAGGELPNEYDGRELFLGDGEEEQILNAYQTYNNRTNYLINQWREANKDALEGGAFDMKRVDEIGGLLIK